MIGKKNNNTRTPKVMEVDAELQGNLIFKDAVNLQINGHFVGKLETKGDLLIGEKGSVQANILGENITIAGEVDGDIQAAAQLRLTSTAKLRGDITTPRLTIEAGALFHGQSRMLAGEDSQARLQKQGGVNRVFLNSEEIAEYLSVEKSLIAEWAQSGKLPGFREGKDWKFEKAKVDEWIANGRLD